MLKDIRHVVNSTRTVSNIAIYYFSLERTSVIRRFNSRALSSAIANAIFRGRGFPRSGYERRNWISCPLPVFFLRQLRGYDGSVPRSGWIIGKATILFHVGPPHTPRNPVCTYSNRNIHTFDPRGVNSVTIIRKGPTRREKGSGEGIHGVQGY